MKAYKSIKQFVEKVKYLALLPAQNIETIFEELLKDLTSEDQVLLLLRGTEHTFTSVLSILDDFIGYFRRHWLRITTPANFSVCREKRRTNNDTERNNRSWHEFVGNHPRFVDFTGMLYAI
ncbi:uncharacterized protein LOC122500376 [Leptopilina heterotoma]|uniref:uncharacterized protein LOC122500376 n=1 Tax=Leptopilina heterotoma TaxID=63436 RepID=UPI001CA8F9F4|nr:uncharacterized protein LOC122500376 [Leptopilina heterotoma]